MMNFPMLVTERVETHEASRTNLKDDSFRTVRDGNDVAEVSRTGSVNHFQLY